MKSLIATFEKEWECAHDILLHPICKTMPHSIPTCSSTTFTAHHIPSWFQSFCNPAQPSAIYTIWENDDIWARLPQMSTLDQRIFTWVVWNPSTAPDRVWIGHQNQNHVVVEIQRSLWSRLLWIFFPTRIKLWYLLTLEDMCERLQNYILSLPDQQPLPRLKNYTYNPLGFEDLT